VRAEFSIAFKGRQPKTLSKSRNTFGGYSTTSSYVQKKVFLNFNSTRYQQRREKESMLYVDLGKSLSGTGRVIHPTLFFDTFGVGLPLHY